MSKTGFVMRFVVGMVGMVLGFGAVLLIPSLVLGIGPSDGLAEQSLVPLLVVQAIAAFCVAFFVTWTTGWRAVGFGPFQWIGFVWFLPAIALLALMIFTLLQSPEFGRLSELNGRILAYVVAITVLIAFSEEVVFRGIILRRGAGRVSPIVAMATSAVLFGLFHMVNAALGQGLGTTATQVGFAAIVGIFLAPLALKLGNLWPLIIWHWAWNVVVVLSHAAGVLQPYIVIGVAFQAVVSLVLWAEIYRKTSRQYRPF